MTYPALIVRRVFATAALAMVLAGCGQDGPRRYHISGAVSYNGQPVRAGRVIFEPDTHKGNSGPAAYADIRNGQYETLPGLGCVGGPHNVRVICLTGISEGNELAEGRMLCPEYRETLDVPLKRSQHDINVPGELTW